MNVTSDIGLLSTIILILPLMAGELALLLTENKPTKYPSVWGALLGLALIVVTSTIVIYESLIIHRQLASEVLDLPSLAREIGHEPDKIADDTRSR